MPRRSKGPRLYTRHQGGAVRFYADLRTLGGGREALIAAGETLATTDPVIAQDLMAKRVRQLEEQRRRKVLLGLEREAQLGAFAAHHLVEKAKSGKFARSWLEQVEARLRVAIDFFGPDRKLTAINTTDVRAFANHLLTQPQRAPRACPTCRAKKPYLAGRAASCTSPQCGARWTVPPMSASTVRHYLNALSNLYRRAESDGCVPSGYNPPRSMIDKPTPKRDEARWLEIHDAALLLESARTLQRKRKDGMPYSYALLATFLLTGGRESEVLGLEVEDVSFDRGIITFRPNRWRRLKTRTSHRSIPLWPQLEEILREYIYGGPTPRVTGLLFPSVREPRRPDRSEARLGDACMITDVRKLLDGIATRAGWQRGEIRTKMFRHTYCATRLQTLDRGAPVSAYTVARELGHGGDALVKRVYGHLGEVRHRSDVVEYRVEQQVERLRAELAASENDVRRRGGAGRLRALIDGYETRVNALRTARAD